MYDAGGATGRALDVALFAVFSGADCRLSLGLGLHGFGRMGAAKQVVLLGPRAGEA